MSTYNPTNTSAIFKQFTLIVMVVFITFSPITSLVFGSDNDYNEVYEISDEDDTKEKVIFKYNQEIKDQKLHLSQNQLSPCIDIFVSDYSPDVPFPPPKEIQIP